MKTANQTAVKGPTKRVPSRAAASSPKAGSRPIRVLPLGCSTKSASMISSETTPAT